MGEEMISARIQREKLATRIRECQDEFDALKTLNEKPAAQSLGASETAQAPSNSLKDALMKHAQAEEQLYVTRSRLEAAKRRIFELEIDKCARDEQINNLKETVAKLTEEKQATSTSNEESAYASDESDDAPLTPYSTKRRNVRKNLLTHFNVQNDIRTSLYVDDQVLEFKLPHADPAYGDLPIPRPVNMAQLPIEDAQEPSKECIACHQLYFQYEFRSHLRICKAFFAYATYCSHLQSFYLNNTAFKTVHAYVCTVEDCQALVPWEAKKRVRYAAQSVGCAVDGSNEVKAQACMHCGKLVGEIKLHLRRCPVWLLELAGKKGEDG